MTGLLWAVVQTPIALLPKYPNTQQQHVMLHDGGSRSQFSDLIGLPMAIALVEECWNKRVQAVKVVLPTWAPCQNKHPHITLSWVSDSAPVEANAMLTGVHESRAIEGSAFCMLEWLEWKTPRGGWRDRPYRLCPTCLKQGVKKYTRSVTGHCRSHRPKE